MNATTIYNHATEAISIYADIHDIKKDFLEALKNDPEGCINSSIPELRPLGHLLKLQREALHEIQKKGGRGNQVAGAKNFLKNAQKHNASRELLHGTWTDSKGRQCFCSGFHAVRLLDPLAGLPKNKDNAEPLSLEKFLDTPREGEQPIPLPDITTVKLHIATEKAENRGKYSGKYAEPIRYDFGPGLPLVNASYLMDMIQLLPDCTATWCGGLSPIYFSSPAGDGLLLPVRRKSE